MKNIEKFILLAVLVGVSGVLLFWAFTFPDLATLTGVSPSSMKSSSPPTLQKEDLDAGLAYWNTPPTWVRPPDNHDLFVSEKYIFFPDQYPSGKFLKKDSGNVKDSNGIELKWYLANGIEFSDANAAHEDPDHDGFSNYIEYNSKSDPRDASSHPAYLSRLRIRDVDQQPFNIEFRGYQTLHDKPVFQIYLKDLPEDQSQPSLKGEGDELGYDNWVVGKFHEIHGSTTVSPGHTMEADLSTLDLTRPDIGLTVTLKYQQETPAPDITAIFNLLMPAEKNQDIRVLVGKDFSLTYEPSIVYTVIKATADGAQIRNKATNQLIDIPKLDPAEWNWVPDADATASPNATGTTTTPPPPGTPPGTPQASP